jgi:hypothetical protein
MHKYLKKKSNYEIKEDKEKIEEERNVLNYHGVSPLM